MLRKKVLAIVLAGVLALGITACAPAQTPASQQSAPAQEQSAAPEQQNAAAQNSEGAAAAEAQTPTGAFPGTPEADTVVLDITSEPVNINSMMVSDQISMGILQHAMSGLTRLDANDSPVADVAESWDINEDKTVYTFKLRQDAKWSNGDPVTANDFYYAYMWQLDPTNAAVGAYFIYENVKGAQDFYDGKADASQLGIKVIDDYTLEIEWNRPITDGLFYVSLPTYFPVNQKAFEQIGADQYAMDADKIVTNGPYKITEWVHNDHITLEKNADHFNADNINIPKARLVMINDENARLNVFMAGELDMTNLYSDQIEQIKSQSEGSLRKYFDGGSYFLGFNSKSEHLSNANLRKALALSIDTQSLLDNVIADGSEAADGLVPHVVGGADGKPYAEGRGSLFAYDPQAAKGYLDQALTELNITAADLKPTLSVYESTYSQNQAAYLQQQWKDNLGIDVEIVVLPLKALYEAKMAGDYEMSVEAYGADINDAMAFLQILTTDNANNFLNYSSAEYDKLINDANATADPVERQNLMIQAEKMLIDDMIIGPLYFTCTTYAVSDKLTGLVRSPFQMFSLVNGASISQ